MVNQTPIWKWIGVVAVASIGCIPIIGQPIQVDDPLFLGVAKQILKTPTNPFGGPPAWHDGDWFSQNANPPLWSYLLAGTAAIFGWNETAFHGLQCLANVALAFGIFVLARRVCLRPLFWTTACLLSPFLLPGRNLMADTLLLALCCWSFELFLQDALDGKRGRGFLAGLLASAALLTKYTGGLLAPIFFILCWRWKTPRVWAWLLPIIAFGLWCSHNQLFYSRMQFFESAKGGGGGLSLLDRARVFTRIVGAMLLWGPVWIIAAWGAVRGWRRLLLGLALPGATLLAAADFYDVIVRFQLAQVIAEGTLVAQFATFIAMGLLVVTAFLLIPKGLDEEDIGGRTRSAMMLWVVLATAFNLFATSAVAFGAVRHLLVMIVPAILLGGNAFDRASVKRPFLRAAAWLTLACGAGLGGLLAHGDRLSALANDEAAREAAKLIAQGRKVWMAGDPALHYEADRVGAAWWRGENDVVAIDGVIVLTYYRGLGFKQHPMLVNQSVVLGNTHLESWNPFRTQSTFASFYGANVVTLPWMIEFSKYSKGPKGDWEYDLILSYRRVR